MPPSPTSSPPHNPPHDPLLILARAIVDPLIQATPQAPSDTPAPPRTALLIDRKSGLIHDIGDPDRIRRSLGLNSPLQTLPTLDRSSSVLLPGLVNAHAHLDLTHIGPRPHDSRAGFMPWIDLVRAQRPTEEDAIRAAVRDGIALARSGGTVAIGDIAGAPRGLPTLAPFHELTEHAMPGVSFIEFFAIGNGQTRGLHAIESLLTSELNTRTTAPASMPPSESLTRLGLQPHAPNTVSLHAYRWAITFAHAHNLPLATHLAESIEEHDFIAHARGPQRTFLESIGLWNDTQLTEIGHGNTPVQHLAPLLRAAPILPVHLNDLSDADLALLIALARPIVYCPRASAYFGAEAHFGPHRYKELLAAGIPVALGTDSIINLPAESATGPDARISTLDEMRFLWRRDQTDPAALLAMATIHGARALGLEENRFRLRPGDRPLGLLAIDIRSAPYETDPLQAILDTDSPPELLETRKNPVTPE